MTPHDARSSHWLAVARAWGAEHGVEARWLQALEAFGGPPELLSVHGRFAQVESQVAQAVAGLGDQICAVLGAEVDADQAALFARRVDAAWRLLTARLDTPATAAPARVLRVGLVARASEVLVGPPPRALRVRAVADFYTTQGAVLLHLGRRGPRLGLQQIVDQADWRAVAGDVHHARLVGPTASGPLHANVLTVRSARLACLDTRALPGAGDLAALARARGAVAAVSGGFFLYSEADIRPPERRTDPVGLLVSDGQVLGGPWLRRCALLWDPATGPRLDEVGAAGLRARWTTGDGVSPWHALGPGGSTTWTRAHGTRVTASTLALAAAGMARPHALVLAAGRVGGAVRLGGGRVPGGGLPVPLSGAVVLVDLVGPAPVQGAAVELELPASLGPVHAGMAGGPRSIRDGVPILDRAAEDFVGTAPPVTFSADETFDQNLLPRMAVGLRGDGTLVFCAVDGRDIQRAPGLTLAGTAALMDALGCTQAMNLDGGSSKRMVVAGQQVDLATTEVVHGGATRSARTRPVHSAILILDP